MYMYMQMNIRNKDQTCMCALYTQRRVPPQNVLEHWDTPPWASMILSGATRITIAKLHAVGNHVPIPLLPPYGIALCTSIFDGH